MVSVVFVSGQAYPVAHSSQRIAALNEYIPGRQVSIPVPSALGHILPAVHGVHSVAFPVA